MKNKVSKISIIFIIPKLHHGGTERVLNKIINNISSNIFNKYIICFNKTKCPFKFDNDINVHYLYPKSKTIFKKKNIISIFFKPIITIYRLAKLLKQFPKNAVLIPFNARPATAYTIIAQLLTKRRVIASFHTIETIDMSFFFPNTLRRGLEILLLKIACKGSDIIITPTKGIISDLTTLLPTINSNLLTIPNPIDLEQINSLRNQTVSVTNTTINKKVTFLHVARLSIEKNHHLLIQATTLLRQKTDDFIVICAGSGIQEKTIKQKIKEEQLENHIKMIGSVNNPYALMSKAEALVLTSHYESFSMVLIEAMSCGTPVISVNCPYGPMEILENGKYGILVPPENPVALAEAMYEVMQNNQLRQELKTKGSKRAAEFDMRNIIGLWENILSIHSRE